MWYNRSCHSHAGTRLCFSSKSRLSVPRSHDCDKREKQQVGGSLIRGTMKQCSRCDKIKPLSEFKKNKSRKNGIDSWCKECHRASCRKYIEINRETIREKARKWRKDNGEKKREYDRRWNEANQEKERERKRKWVEDNREKVRAINREYGRSHPDKVLARITNRRARKNGNGGRITASDRRWLMEFYEHTCLCCGRREPEIQLELDHVVPLAIGGHNAIENAQPLCKMCNSSKGTKHIDYRPMWEGRLF
jgi:5-methylcytosine-specific restriction endonuclease McrA